MKKLTLILVVCLLLSSLNGCGLVGSIAGEVVNDVVGSTTKTFTVSGVTIEAPSNMEDVSGETGFEDFALALANNEVAIIGLKEQFVDFEGGAEMTLEDYTDLVILANSLDSTVSDRAGEDYQYFTFEAASEGMNFKYLGATFKGSDAFWFIQVYSLVSDFDEAAFLGYLDTLTLS